MSEASAPVAAAPADAAPVVEAGSAQVVPEPAKGKASPAKAPQQSTKPELFEVKVDGKIIKMTRDEILQQASLGHAADRRFKEAAAMRKQAESVVGRMRDPKQVIAALQDPALGLDKNQIREAFEEWYAAEFIEPESLSPEQKKLREAEARLKKYEEDDKSREEEKQRAHQESLTTQAREQIQKQIIEALDVGKLPKTNFTLRRLAYWMERNRANGFNAPTEVLVGQVKNEINTSLRDLVEQSDGEVLVNLLGDNLIQKLRKYDLEQLRKMRSQPAAPAQDQSNAPKEDRHGRAITSSEVNQRLRNLQKTGKY